MAEQQREQLLKTIAECIEVHPNVPIGPVLENSNPDRPGIWFRVLDQVAYLGATFESAMLTAQLSDWWFPERDGRLLTDDIQWFEERARLGEGWQQKEFPMFKEERRTRRTLNIELATDDDPNRTQGN